MAEGVAHTAKYAPSDGDAGSTMHAYMCPPRRIWGLCAEDVWQEVAKVDASIARLEALRTTLSAQHEAIVEQGKAS
eukprot:30511-Eustigmatos_ZCMA.PRE.1